MKTLFTTIFAVLFIGSFCAGQDTLYIYDEGAVVIGKAVTDIDSITFYKPGSTVTDIEGNVYKTVKIGSQIWMAENLKTRKFNDGKAIPLVTDAAKWAALSSPAFCWYNNDSATNNATYGALYNYYVVNTRKLCPSGWHAPSDAEWTVLTDYLGGKEIAGGKLKEAGLAHWADPNTSATNESGFTALPGGCRYTFGEFFDLGSYSYWWSSTEYSTGLPWGRYVYYDLPYVIRDNFLYSQSGLSVRCLRDE